MPELPDIEAYLEALRRMAVGHVVQRIRVAIPMGRTQTPPEAEEVVGLGERRRGFAPP